MGLVLHHHSQFIFLALLKTHYKAQENEISLLQV